MGTALVCCSLEKKTGTRLLEPRAGALCVQYLDHDGLNKFGSVTEGNLGWRIFVARRDHGDLDRC